MSPSVSEGGGKSGSFCIWLYKSRNVIFHSELLCILNSGLVLPRSPHEARIGHGGHAQTPSAPSSHLCGALVVLAVDLVQVRARVLAGRGRGRREGRRLTAGEAASSWGSQSAAVAGGRVRDQVHQHVLQVVLVQRHALQQMVEKLGRHCCVDPRTAGHERVDLVHALDVAGCKPLTGLPVQSVLLCDEKRRCDRRNVGFRKGQTFWVQEAKTCF